MNRSDLQKRILESVGDNPDLPVFFSQVQLNSLIDEANEILSEDIQAIKRTALFPLKAGSGFVYTPAIADDFMAPLRIWDHGNGRRLIPLSMTELDDLDLRWQTTTGKPEVWFPVSWDLLGTYPRPAAASGVLRIDYLAWPRSLLDADDRPELPEATHDALVLYGEYMACLKKWDSQSAMIPLKALQLHKDVAKSRSGISRISVRSMTRSNVPRETFPSTYVVGGST